MLLLLGFLLLLLGGTLAAPPSPTGEPLPHHRSEEAIATLADQMGRIPAEAVSILEPSQQGKID